MCICLFVPRGPTKPQIISSLLHSSEFNWRVQKTTLTHCIEIFQRLWAQRFLSRSEKRSTSWCHEGGFEDVPRWFILNCMRLVHANIASSVSRRFEGDLRRRQAPEFSSRDFLRWITYARMNAVTSRRGAIKGDRKFLGSRAHDLRAKKRDECATKRDPLGGLKILNICFQMQLCFLTEWRWMYTLFIVRIHALLAFSESEIGSAKLRSNESKLFTMH